MNFDINNLNFENFEFQLNQKTFDFNNDLIDVSIQTL